MGAQAQLKREERETTPASPKALKKSPFRGKILQRFKPDRRVFISEQMLRQHLAEAKENTKEGNFFVSHGPHLLLEADVIDAVDVQRLIMTEKSINLLQEVSEKSNYGSVKEEALKGVRFTSGFMPVHRQ